MSSDLIAIIGMGCRFPGAEGPAAFWNLLRQGIDAVREAPPERFGPPLEARTTGRGGFLEQVDEFDASFFGVTPREAVHMDPQQRLLLEVAWEALEDAGQVRDDLAGTPVGVFVGISSFDYGAMQLSEPRFSGDGYANTGSAMSIAANRISYFFDFRGPSMAIDTACSSSLVATHLACQSLRTGESTLALAGGVNVILSPAIALGFEKLGILSADGRCKPFDARADGFVRSEGAGILALKLLDRAVADGDPIYAVIHAVAVNQDGRTNGLTAPSGIAQEALLRRVLGIAGVSPSEVAYVEAFGSGTGIGDSIEANALGSVLAEARPPDRKCPIGSLKSNLGHTEAASGVASLIKVALALKHEQIPPTLNFETPNPYIPFDDLPIYVQTTSTAWPKTPRRFACVSSFGFGGTNAVAILGPAPAAPLAPNREAAATEHLCVLPMSASSEGALESLAQSYLRELKNPSDGPNAPSLFDVCYTASRRRSHLAHRLAIAARRKEDVIEALEAFLRGEPHRGMASGKKPGGRRRRVAFLFSAGDGKELDAARSALATFPASRDALEAWDRAWRDETSAQEQSKPTDKPREVSVFGLHVALVALWRDWGIRPDALLGHGIGELAAAHVAGCISLADAASVLSNSNARPGAGGTRDELPARASVPLYSSVTGTRAQCLDLERGRWDDAPETSGLVAAVRSMAADGYSIFVELGSAPGLRRILEHEVSDPALVLLPSEKDEGDPSFRLSSSVGALYALGQPVDWSKFSPAGKCVRLPSYPWQRERFWLERRVAAKAEPAPAMAEEARRSATPESPFYYLRWEHASEPAPSIHGTDRRGSWVLFTDSGDYGTELSSVLSAGGASVFVVSRGTRYEREGERAFRIRPEALEDFERLLHEVETLSPHGVAGAVHLWSLDVPPAEATTRESLYLAQDVGCSAVLHWTQSVIGRKACPRIWAVTHAPALIADHQARAPAVGEASLWGLGRAISHEHPGAWGGLVALADVAPREAAAFLASELQGGGGEDSVLVGPGGRRVARLAPLTPSRGTDAVEPLREDAAYLITGGLGELGLRVAHSLARRGARALILLSRSKLLPREHWDRIEGASRMREQVDAIQSLESLGARVHIVSVDVADEARLNEFLERWRNEEASPIRGVVHAANWVGMRALKEMDLEALDATFRPKVDGGWNLHRCFEGRDLDFFILFSSAASVLGLLGEELGHSAAANAFLDALAHYRRSRGLPALSIGWGPWLRVGVTARTQQDERASRYGVRGFEPERGVELFEELLSVNREMLPPHVLAVDCDWELFSRSSPGSHLLLGELVGRSESQRERSEAISGSSRDLEQVLRVAPEKLQEALESALRLRASRVFGIAPDAIDLDRPLVDIGMDSLMGVELKNSIESELQVSLPLLELLRSASISRVASFIAQRLRGRAGDETGAVPAGRAESSARSTEED